jgi:hypothetical protein
VQSTGPTEEPAQSVEIDGLEATSCVGAGLGFDLAAKGIVVVGGKIAGTVGAQVPVESGGLGQVGTGVVWKSGVSAVVDGLAISGSAIQAMVIDGPVGAGSKLSNVQLAGGDEAKGIVQQQVDTMDLAPEVDGSTPNVDRNQGVVSDVPIGPSVPPAIP